MVSERHKQKEFVQLEVRNRNWWLKSPGIETQSEKRFLMKTGIKLKPFFFRKVNVLLCKDSERFPIKLSLGEEVISALKPGF